MICSGSSESNKIHLPLVFWGTYSFTVDWGDTTQSTITTWNQAETTHTYASEGVYDLNITGTIVGWRFNNEGDRLKLIEVMQWGCLHLGNFGGYFYGCSNLNLTTTDALNLTGTTDLSQTFRDCICIGNSGNLNSWNTSNINSMLFVFFGASSFNQPLASWNVSNVISTQGMFYGATSFNQPLGSWNVSNVTDMRGMFYGAHAFNQPLGSWNVSNVTDMGQIFALAFAFNQSLGSWNITRLLNMEFMFSDATTFNQPLDSWNVSSVTDMGGMFAGATAFNQPLDSWNVSSVTYMGGMFGGASLFNQSLDSWNVSSVTDMGNMFYGASAFNQPLGSWNVSSVTNMGSMFYGASAFNQPLDSWNVSSVTNMQYMFNGASAFNQSLGSWNVSSVTNMQYMFNGASAFNQPLDSWNISRVIDMQFMFNGTSAFNQPLGSWNVSRVTNMQYMFNGACSFNQSLDSWNVSSVTNMQYMFNGASAFNQPLDSWNVSSVTNMRYMFYGASAFNQPLGSWNVSRVTNMQYMFAGVTLSTPNYNDLLLRWAQLPLQTGVQFYAGGSKYSRIAIPARQTLIGSFGWFITDGGQDYTAPIITGTGLAPWQLCNASAPTFTLTIVDSYLNETWYSLDGGTTNTTCGLSGTLAAQWGGRPNGTVTVTFWANNTLGNVNSTIIMIRKDIIAPTISNTGLTPYHVYGVTAPAYNLIITEGNLNVMWYSLDGGTTNTTCGLSGTLAAQWGAYPNGTITVTFWANDTMGNVGTTSVVIRKDIIAPSITDTGVTLYQVYGAATPSFSLTISEVNLEVTWYSLDGGITNTTCGLSGTLTAQWGGLPNGTVTVTFWANDTAGNLGTMSVTVWKDIANPIIEITEPSTRAQFTSAPTLTLSITDANLHYTWYTIGTSADKYFFTGTSVHINEAVWAALPAGDVVVHIFGNDTLSNEVTLDLVIVKLGNQGGNEELPPWELPAIFAAVGVAAAVIVGVTIRKKRAGTRLLEDFKSQKIHPSTEARTMIQSQGGYETMKQSGETLKKAGDGGNPSRETESDSKEILQKLRNLVEISDEGEFSLDYLSEVLEIPKLDLIRALVKNKPSGIHLKGNNLIVDNKAGFIKQ